MKQRIIGCTLNQIGEYGLRSLTMDAVASQMHISKRTLYMYFASKEILLEACISEWLSSKQLLVPTGGNLIDELCALYGAIRSIDMPRVMRCCRDLRQCSTTAYRFSLDRLFDYADACGTWAERDAETGYLRRNLRRQTVSAVVYDFLIRLFGSGCEQITMRSYVLSPEILIVFTRGLCTIKGRAYLDKRLKTMA